MMKKQLLITSLLIISSLHAKAQCFPAIPSNAVVVNSNQIINSGFDPIWVCSNDTLISDGGLHNIFLEPGSRMTSGGGIDSIYVKVGASFFMNGGIHVIFYENFSDIQIGGGIPVEILCSNLSFNYVNAPVNGCALLLAAAFQASDSILCSGSCISFNNQSTNSSSWQWSFPGGNPSSSTVENPPSICYNNSGTYDVTLIASNGGDSDTTTSFINVITGLPTPNISVSNDTIFSEQGYGTYQWYFNNILIPGANNYYYVADQGGIYSVVVTGDQGCGTVTATISYIATGVSSFGSASLFTIFPNPSNAVITVRLNGFSVLPCEVTIVDFLGRIIDDQLLKNPEMQFDFSDEPAGVYYVNCHSEQGMYSRKVVIAKAE